MGLSDGGFQWWLGFRGGNLVVVGLGFGGGVESVAGFWWWVTMMGLDDGGFNRGYGFGRVSMSHPSPSL